MGPKGAKGLAENVEDDVHATFNYTGTISASSCARCRLWNLVRHPAWGHKVRAPRHSDPRPALDFHSEFLPTCLFSSWMTTIALSELLGAAVYDPSGAVSGRVREVTMTPQEDRSRISSLIIKTKTGNRVLPFTAVAAINGGIKSATAAGEWLPANGAEGMFLLERDLLDQQVIDINGRKVVRVNDVDLQLELQKGAVTLPLVLRVHSVDVGARGAVRRLLRGVAPKAALRALLGRIPPRTIPWNFVDVIETDPAR